MNSTPLEKVLHKEEDEDEAVDGSPYNAMLYTFYFWSTKTDRQTNRTTDIGTHAPCATINPNICMS